MADVEVTDVDVAVIGAGPAGLSAALNLVRAHRRTLVIDSNRPRNAATLRSRGFLTRDGMPPLELRRIGREELERYPGAEVVTARVDRIVRDRDGFLVEGTGLRGAADVRIIARSVVIASGLNETLPPLPSIRIYYGTHLHSCIECDGFEKSGLPLALIGESDDLAERAMLISQWTRDLIVFTNNVGRVTAHQEATLGSLGIRVERRAIVDVTGERDRMTGVALEGGVVIPRVGGFVRPNWTPSLAFADDLALAVDDQGLLVVDECGRTSVSGVYAAGDTVQPGPRQLIVAAGAGATVASTVNRDLITRSVNAAEGTWTGVLAPPVQ